MRRATMRMSADREGEAPLMPPATNLMTVYSLTACLTSINVLCSQLGKL
jgi:hypothetical protein